MEFLKTIFFLLVDLLSGHSISDLMIEATQKARAALREEILGILLRFLAGLVLTSAIIFSLITIGQQVNGLILNYENGPLLSMAIFGAIAVLCSFFLNYLFRAPGKQEREIGRAKLRDNESELQKAISGLFDGLIEPSIDSSHTRVEAIAPPTYERASGLYIPCRTDE